MRSKDSWRNTSAWVSSEGRYWCYEFDIRMQCICIGCWSARGLVEAEKCPRLVCTELKRRGGAGTGQLACDSGYGGFNSLHDISNASPWESRIDCGVNKAKLLTRTEPWITDSY
jgi:hypothetical protein